jgi:hypothetical protein
MKIFKSLFQSQESKFQEVLDNYDQLVEAYKTAVRLYNSSENPELAKTISTQVENLKLQLEAADWGITCMLKSSERLQAYLLNDSTSKIPGFKYSKSFMGDTYSGRSWVCTGTSVLKHTGDLPKELIKYKALKKYNNLSIKQKLLQAKRIKIKDQIKSLRATRLDFYNISNDPDQFYCGLAREM